MRLCVRVADELDEQAKRAKKAAEELVLKEIMQTIHRMGVNYRYLGKVRSHVKEPAMSTMLFIEMVGRMIKKELWSRVRTTTTYISEDALRKIFCNYLNQIILNKNQQKGQQFWLRTLPSMLREQYGSGFAAEDMFHEDEQDCARLLSLVNIPLLFSRLEETMRVSFTNSAKRSLAEDPLSFELVSCDIKRVGAKVKTTNLLLIAEGSSLHEQMNSRDGSPCKRLFVLALRSYTRAMNATPDDETVCSNYASLLVDFAVKQLKEMKIHALTRELEFPPFSLCKQAFDILLESKNFKQIFTMAKTLHGICKTFTGVLEMVQALEKIEQLTGLIADCYRQVQVNDPSIPSATHFGDLQVLLASYALLTHTDSKAKQLYDHAGTQYRRAIQQGEFANISADHIQWITQLDNIDLAQVIRLYNLDSHFKLVSTSSCPFLSDTLLEQLTNHVKAIHTLQLDSLLTCSFSPTSISNLVQRHGPALREISIQFPTMFETLFLHTTRLKVLTLHSTRDRDLKLEKAQSSLKTLDLSWTQASDRVLAHLFRKFKRLKILLLEGSAKLVGTSLKHLASSLLTLNLNKASPTSFLEKNIKYLPTACPNLQNLYLSECNITDCAATEIANCLKLQSLDLSANTTISTDALRLIVSNAKSLQSVNFSGLARGVCDELCQLMSVNNPDLTELLLDRCGEITDKSLISLASGCKKLEKLSFFQARLISNEGIAAITCLPLNFLCIDYCNLITDIKPLKACPKLRDLSMQGLNRLTEENILAFFADQRVCNVARLNLSSCLSVTPAFVSRIQNRYPELELSH
jgi:hypothetical protein